MSLLDNMPHVISIAHRSYVNDEAGGDVATVADPYETELPCWVQTPSSRDIKEFAARNMNVTHVIYMPTDPGLVLDDQIVYARERLRLLYFNECTAGLNRAIRLGCEIDRMPQP